MQWSLLNADLIYQVVLRLQKVTFFANSKLKGWGWVGRAWRSHFGARKGQQGVRAHVRATGKALEEDDRQTDRRFVRYNKMFCLCASGRSGGSAIPGAGLLGNSVGRQRSGVWNAGCSKFPIGWKSCRSHGGSVHGFSTGWLHRIRTGRSGHTTRLPSRHSGIYTRCHTVQCHVQYVLEQKCASRARFMASLSQPRPCFPPPAFLPFSSPPLPFHSLSYT